MAATQYCVLRDVQKQLSVEGVNLRLDDDPQVWSDVIDWASLTIDEHCRTGYTQANLQISDWVKRQTAVLAAYELCERRGNPCPQSLIRKVVRLIGTPEKPGGILGFILRGSRNISDIPRRKADIPVVSNVRVRLDPSPRIVVETGRSTGTPSGYSQHEDQLEPPGFDYSI